MVLDTRDMLGVQALSARKVETRTATQGKESIQCAQALDGMQLPKVLDLENSLILINSTIA